LDDAKRPGAPTSRPNDLHHTWAKTCRAAGAELEQIQVILGHGSVQTTERCVGTKQELVHAPNDDIKLTVAV
jgi:integrase